MAQDVLASLPKHIALGLNVFCIPRAYPEADYYSIINHPQILDPVCLDALEKLVVLAKRSGEGQTAFMMAWKKVLLEGCIDKGVEKFFSEFREGGEQALQKLLWKVGPPESYMKEVPPELMRFYEESTNHSNSTAQSATVESLPVHGDSWPTETPTRDFIPICADSSSCETEPAVDSVMLGLQKCVLEDDTCIDENEQQFTAFSDILGEKHEDEELLAFAKTGGNLSEKSNVTSVCEWLDNTILDQVRGFTENDSTFQSLLLLLLRDIPRFQKLVELWGSKNNSWRLNSLTVAKGEAYPFEEEHKRRLVDELCPELRDLNVYAEDFGSKFFELLFYVAQWPEDADGLIMTNNNAVGHGETRQSTATSSRTSNVDASPQKVEEEIAREKIEAEIIGIRRSLKQKQQRYLPSDVIAQDVSSDFGTMLNEYQYSGISNLYYIIEERERCLVDIMSESSSGTALWKSNGSSSCFLSIVELMSGFRQHMLMRFVSKIVVVLLSIIEVNWSNPDVKRNNEYQAIRDRMKTKLADRKQLHANKKGKAQQASQCAGIDLLESDAEYYYKHYSTLFTVDPPSPESPTVGGGNNSAKHKPKKNSKKHKRRR